ncbi:hypothetical protein, partial [Staphylococcus aureus]|uniref:hypothetical protein n=1 Tax=Staphylococcus aureus TaxID=1280 RepID=UPI001C92DAAA
MGRIKCLIICKGCLYEMIMGMSKRNVVNGSGVLVMLIEVVKVRNFGINNGYALLKMCHTLMM